MWRKFCIAASLLATPQIYCNPNLYQKNLPEYSFEEVSKHKTPGESVWLIVGKGVYDVTRFVDIHPGGNKILLAAGGCADQFWGFYRIHHQKKVYDMLESMRIGNVKPGEKSVDIKDPYLDDPQREKTLVLHSEKPYNAEPPNDILSDNIITPTSLFFIRNHLPVPVIDDSSYQLEIVFEDDKCSTLTLDELKKKFEIVRVESTIQCAGNRRFEANQQGITRGTEWRGGAIGNAIWTGIRVYDIIKYFGELNPKYKHIQIEALDTDPNGPFGTSIPIEKGLDKDTILAFEMNGEPISRDHGFPLRLIVPGYVGVRNIKWVKRITLSESESPLIWHKRDYRLFSPNDSISNVVFEDRHSIYETPVQSIICTPVDGATFSKKEEDVVLKGIAYSGGGRGIARVEVTGDRGDSWTEAKIQRGQVSNGKSWGWVLWEANMNTNDVGKDICVRAVDNSGNTQPENLKTVWNYRGLLNNSWHCISMIEKKEA